MSCKAIPDPAEWAARFSGLIVRQQDPSGSFQDQGLTSRQGQDGKRGGTQRAIATARASRRKPSRTTQCPRSRRIGARPRARSEEHTSELQSLMRISYAVFCWKKKKTKTTTTERNKTDRMHNN